MLTHTCICDLIWSFVAPTAWYKTDGGFRLHMMVLVNPDDQETVSRVRFSEYIELWIEVSVQQSVEPHVHRHFVYVEDILEVAS